MQRGRISSFFLIVVALVSAILPACFFGVQARAFYESHGRYFAYTWPGLQDASLSSLLAGYQVVHDRFQSAQHVPWFGVNGKIQVRQCDPESGAGFDHSPNHARRADLKSVKQNWNALLAVGTRDHLWLVEQGSPWPVYDFDGEKFIETASLPISYNARTGGMNGGPASSFELNGRLSIFVEKVAGQRELFQLVDGRWQSLGEIKLLDTDRGWISESGQTLVDPDPSPPLRNQVPAKNSTPGAVQNRFQFGHSSRGSIRILTIGDTQHVFWALNNRLLHHRGIDLIPLIPVPTPSSQTVTSEPILPVSALEPENTIGIAHGWTLVTPDLRGDNYQFWYPVAVGTQPAVIFCQRNEEPHRPVRALRLEQGEWTQFASTTLPFLSYPIIAGSRDDGSTAYLAVATRLGHTQVLALEPSGFRLTKFDHIGRMPLAASGYFTLFVMLVWSLFFAALITCIASLIIRKDRLQYEFGQQSVIKASLIRRGLARFVDLSLLGGTTAALFLTLQSILITDWQQIFEMRVAGLYDDPQVILETRIIVGCIVWHCLAMLALIALQGRSGITPGKWLFGIRTVRTALRPPGFNHSLLRELLFYCETVAILCWGPGILFIVYNRNRQRLGDLIADTIVINSSRNSLGWRIGADRS